MIEKLEELVALCEDLGEERCKRVEREVSYFENHRGHLHYQQVQAEGCPKGSGAMESTCSQLQNRFKRTGPFWTLPGETHLLALELARRNDDWDEIWWLDSEQ